MKRTVFCLLWAAAAAAGDLSQVQKLTDSRRFFEVRRALQQPGWNDADTLLYRGLVASRFGHEAEGIELLRKFLDTKPAPDLARTALEEQSVAYVRLGRYKESAQAMADALLLPPEARTNRDEDENSRLLFDTISGVAPQSVEFDDAAQVKATGNPLGSWNVPVQVSGTAGDWIFDTGANISTVTESEARRMGMTIRESKAWVNGSTGKRNSLRLAVAADLRFGPAHLRNVVFLVLADKSLYIEPIHQQITGILGLPVLRALGRVGIDKDGAVSIHAGKSAAAGDPNLHFDGGSVIVEIGHGGHQLQMMLDTGANSTDLYPSFRAALTASEIAALKSGKQTFGGAGGTVERQLSFIPELRIEFFDTPVELKNRALLPETPKGDGRYRDGVVGMDALRNGFLLDFDTMRFEVR
ncbi:MAG TPA: aspartyl protease family protein [Verrucomicrobiae bacterium]|nr:aspartyl protease family protein [Verrucomicrobiae bacterium]